MKSIALSIAFVFAAFLMQAQTKLQEGTVVEVKLLETLGSGTCKQGEIVNLEVVEDVLVGDKVVIEKGAKVTGTVVLCQEKRTMGRKGELDFSVDYVTAVDGQNIRTRSVAGGDGKDRVGGIVAAAAIVNPFLLFIKGKDVVIEKGTTFSVYIDQNYEIK